SVYDNVRGCFASGARAYIPRAMAYASSLRFSRLLLPAMLAGATLAIFVACSADGTGDPIVEAPPTEPPPTASLPKTPVPEGGNDIDAGGDASKDASKDAKADTGVDAGKPAPNPGDPCTKLDEIIPRTCGACGKQQALCMAKPDG